MSGFQAAGVPVTIANGQTSSPWILARTVYQDAVAIALMAPVGLVVATPDIEVSHNPEDTVPIVYMLQIGDVFADASPPPAGKARVYLDITAFAGFRITAGSAVTGDQTYQMSKQVETDRF